jgi:hypothetical protein
MHISSYNRNELYHEQKYKLMFFWDQNGIEYDDSIELDNRKCNNTASAACH